MFNNLTICFISCSIESLFWVPFMLIAIGFKKMSESQTKAGNQKKFENLKI